MYLSKLRISNYRGIEELSITFHPKMNVIIGANGCFKSTVIDAIRLFYSLGDRYNDIEVVPEDFHKAIVNENGTETVKVANTIQIDYCFEDLSPAQQGAYAIYLANIGNPARLCALVRLIYEKDDKDRIIRKCIPGDPEAQNKLDFNTLQLFHSYYLGAVRDSTHDLMSTKNNLLGKVIKRKIENNNTENVIRDIIKAANNSLLQRKEVTDTKQGLNANLDKIDIKNGYNVDVQIEQSRIEYIVNVIKPYIPFGPMNEDSIRLWQNSLGYNNLIYIATVLSDIYDIHAEDKESIYALLIEEPEAHLHPQLQVNLYKFLKEADESPNCQLFITSHSPTLTSRIPLENLIVLNGKAYNVGECFNKDREKENIIHNTNGDTYKEKDFTKYRHMLERYLDVTRSQLLFAKGCVFIEGISEAQLLETFSKIVGKSLADNQIEIVNAESVAFYQFLLLYNSSDPDRRLPNKVAFITDGDQYTDSKKVSLSALMNNYDNIKDLREKIKSGVASSRIGNLKSVRNNQQSIKICDGYKTLEYQICLYNVADTIAETQRNDLYVFLQKEYAKSIESAKEYFDSLGTKVLSDDDKMEVAIVLWKCISQKSTFAQDLSFYLEERMHESGKPLVFQFPAYIQEAINHVVP